MWIKRSEYEQIEWEAKRNEVDAEAFRRLVALVEAEEFTPCPAVELNRFIKGEAEPDDVSMKVVGRLIVMDHTGLYNLRSKYDKELDSLKQENAKLLWYKQKYIEMVGNENEQIRS